MITRGTPHFRKPPYPTGLLFLIIAAVSTVLMTRLCNIWWKRRISNDNQRIITNTWMIFNHRSIPAAGDREPSWWTLRIQHPWFPRRNGGASEKMVKKTLGIIHFERWDFPQQKPSSYGGTPLTSWKPPWLFCCTTHFGVQCALLTWWWGFRRLESQPPAPALVTRIISQLVAVSSKHGSKVLAMCCPNCSTLRVYCMGVNTICWGVHIHNYQLNFDVHQESEPCLFFKQVSKYMCLGLQTVSPTSLN